MSTEEARSRAEDVREQSRVVADADLEHPITERDRISSMRVMRSGLVDDNTARPATSISVTRVISE